MKMNWKHHHHSPHQFLVSIFAK